MKKEIRLILIIVSLALFIRIANINKIIVSDEYVQTKAVLEHNSVGFDKGTGIPPLTTWVRIAFSWIWGINIWSLKLVSVIFGLISIIFIYLLAKELYNKKTAFWATVLVTFSAWHILGTTSISFNGAFLTFYYLLTIFCFVKYLKTKLKMWLYLTGISFGLAMLTKLDAILIIPIIAIYFLIKTRNIKQFFIDFLIIFGLSLMVFSIFPLLALLTDFSYFTVVIGHTAVFKNFSFNILLLLIQYMLAFFWMGPLFIGFYLIKLFRFNKKDILMHLWIIIIFLFFTFGVKENFRPLERYFLVILPPLAILGGNQLSKLKINKKNTTIFLLVFTIFLGFTFFLNLSHNEILQFYPKSNFVNNVLKFKWDFLVPFTGDQGPIGMYMAFSGIALSFIFSFLFLGAYIITKAKKIKLATTLFLCFLAISFSYNVFMAQEMIFSATNVNINKISEDIINYSLKNNLKEPIYIFRNYALKYYLDSRYNNIRMLDFKDEFKKSVINEINSGTVIIVDFPSINKNSFLWKKINKCNLIKTFYDKNIRLGYVFNCN